VALRVVSGSRFVSTGIYLFFVSFGITMVALQLIIGLAKLWTAG
jgi:hypothetical protein